MKREIYFVDTLLNIDDRKRLKEDDEKVLEFGVPLKMFLFFSSNGDEENVLSTLESYL
jgi:hypothetical protein